MIDAYPSTALTGRYTGIRISISLLNGMIETHLLPILSDVYPAVYGGIPPLFTARHRLRLPAVPATARISRHQTWD